METTTAESRGSTLPLKVLLPWHVFDSASIGLVHPDGYDVDKNVAYLQGLVLSGFTLKRFEGHWVFVIKGVRRGRNLVAYEHGNTLGQCLDIGLYHASQGTLRFQDDDYPFKRTESPSGASAG